MAYDFRARAVGALTNVARSVNPEEGDVYQGIGEVAANPRDPRAWLKLGAAAVRIGPQVAAAAGASDETRAYVGQLRRELEEIKAKFNAISKGFEKTAQFNQAAMRLSGKLPDSKYYDGMFFQASQLQDRMDDKFQQWKGEEAPLVVGRTFLDIVKRSLHS